jgi:regulator of extracellular matrix RemA (YlzA/DUF370 family)
MATRPYKTRQPQPLANLTDPSTGLPRDPNFVQTWDSQPDQNYKDPIDYSRDGYSQPAPQPQQSITNGYNLPVADPARPEASPARRTFQSFDEYRNQFSDLAPASSATDFDPNPYKTAYEAQVAAANQGRDVGVSQATADRTAALETAQKTADKQIKQIQDSYDPNLQALKQSLSDRGILDSSAAGEKLIKLLNDNQNLVKEVNDNLVSRQKEIESTYGQRTAAIQQQTSQALADQQTLLAQRLDALSKDRRIADENKKQFEYQIYQDYQKEIESINAQDRQARLDEYQMKQDALDYELQTANATGMFQGAPTMQARQMDFENQLAQAKFDADQIAASKKGGGGGGSGGAGLGSDEGAMQEGIAQIMALIDLGYSPEDAYARIEKNYNAAGKRALNNAFIQATTVPVDNRTAAQRLFEETVGGLLPWTGLNKTPKPLIQLDPTKRKTPQVKASDEDGLDALITASAAKYQ